MNADTFAARLQQCLDERRDPLADPELVDWLATHPDDLHAYARLHSRLQALPRAAMPRLAPVARRTLLFAAVATALVTATVLWTQRPAEAANLPFARGAITPSIATDLRTTTIQTRTVLLDRHDARIEVFRQWSVPR